MLPDGGASLSLEKHRHAKFVQVIVCKRDRGVPPGVVLPLGCESTKSQIFQNWTMSVCWELRLGLSLYAAGAILFVCFIVFSFLHQ